MNAVEIEQAITDLAEQPFDAASFPYAFLEAFGNKATTIQRLRSGATNKSGLGGVLQTNMWIGLYLNAFVVSPNFRYRLLASTKPRCWGRAWHRAET